MQIWVDADACPRAVKEMLYRAAVRWKITVTLVANQPLRTPPSPYLRVLRVGAGFDVADGEIVRQVHPGDLVVTADIPLAAAVVAKEALALDPRGDLYDADTIQERLMVRNLLDELRGSGVDTGGPPPLGPADLRAFANQLDRLLARAGQS
jgi:uncharacterized protein YaiI (UPF0178 family)